MSTKNAQLLRLPAVRELAGNISRATVWRWSRDGTMPAPIRLGPNTSVWRADEIEAWLRDPAAWAAKGTPNAA